MHKSWFPTQIKAWLCSSQVESWSLMLWWAQFPTESALPRSWDRPTSPLLPSLYWFYTEEPHFEGWHLNLDYVTRSRRLGATVKTQDNANYKRRLNLEETDNISYKTSRSEQHIIQTTSLGGFKQALNSRNLQNSEAKRKGGDKSRDEEFWECYKSWSFRAQLTD